MYTTCIAVVDASRARLFSFRRSQNAEGMQEQLTEEKDLVNPARRQRPSELFSDSGGSGRTGQLQYGIDDHREAHVEQLDAEFSRLITSELADLVRATGTQRLIVCASPRMLGELRDARTRLPASDVKIDEIARDLVKLTPTMLRSQLASYGLLPEAVR